MCYVLLEVKHLNSTLCAGSAVLRVANVLLATRSITFQIK